MSFSYPDIFTGKSFWTTPLCDSISLTTVPVRTRFPRVYTSPFETAVKGVSSYDSRNPANAHRIFAGLFQGDRELFRDVLKNFESERIDGGLEVDFLNFCANKNILKQHEYYDFWLNADSSRDFDLIEERFSLV
jgi:NDP-sugar pyrophosphorylase family protein